jgi:hypothetical protein
MKRLANQMTKPNLSFNVEFSEFLK